MPRTPWPHAPLHRLSEQGTYFVTVGTYLRQHYFRGRERLSVLNRGLLSVCREFGWAIEALAMFSNHYHFVAHSPFGRPTAENLPAMLGKLHGKTARWINRLDKVEAPMVWHNY